MTNRYLLISSFSIRNDLAYKDEVMYLTNLNKLRLDGDIFYMSFTQLEKFFLTKIMLRVLKKSLEPHVDLCLVLLDSLLIYTEGQKCGINSFLQNMGL